MKKDRLQCSNSEQRQFFRPDVLSILPLIMNMATRGGSVQPARLVVYTSFGRFSLMLVVLSFITLATRGYSGCVVPASSGCTTAFLHTILLYYRGLAEMVLSYHLICFYDSRISVSTFKRVSSRSALSNNFSPRSFSIRY